MAKKDLFQILAGIGIGTAATLVLTNVIPSIAAGKANPMSAAQACPHGSGDMMSMMSSMQIDSEADFLRQMIPHHQEAVDSAKILLAGTNRPEMKQFAQDIIRVQTAEIEQMQSWLKQWYPQATAANYTPMMRDLKQLKGDDLDKAFLADMKMHHMGAIMMSRSLLADNLSQHQEVKTLAQQIISAQRAEIQQMQAWQQAWFGKAATEHNRHHMSMPGM